MTERSGFEELQHTADWAVRVWADEIPGLFVESARAMYSLSGAKRAAGQRQIKMANGWGPDLESLLVAFLSELIFYAETESLSFPTIVFRLKPEGGGHRYEARLEGWPAVWMNKPIKAVTYHNLRLSRTERGHEVEIVFDV